ncbi:MAG: universal stress protein [Candidatus Bathyarchaeia archaeon]|jgi:nucleotide-binding universal stress UspA family protein
MITKILIPIDGSEPANKALDLSIYLADKCSAEILVLSVMEPKIIPVFTQTYAQPMEVPQIPPVSPAEMQSMLKRQRTSYENLLATALNKSRKNYPNLKVSTKLAEGQPADKIIETAKEGNFNMIVIGSRGLSGIKEFILGSVSNTVANKANCPVLIVK